MSAAVSIKRARRRAGLTQRQLASRCGTSQARLSTYESGAARPTDATLRRILHAARLRPSEALDTHLDEVLAMAEQHGLTNVRVVGSVVRGEDTVDSDLDLLVDAPDSRGIRSAGILSGFADAVTDRLGVRVDVLAEPWLDPTVAPSVLAEAEAL